MAERLLHVTWGWFLVTMSTGGMAVLLSQQPHTFRGLETIGKIVFIWDLALFVAIVLLITARFVRRPELLLRSLRNPGELLVAPALLLSIADIIICMQAYGRTSTGPWLVTAVRVLFWIYIALAVLQAVLVYLDLFTARTMTTKDILPNWLLPILPVMLSGTIAGTIASSQTPSQAMDILVAGVTLQGLGFWVAIALYGAFASRFMKIGLSIPNLRPGGLHHLSLHFWMLTTASSSAAMFVAVSPPAFTCLALLNMTEAIPKEAHYFQVHPTAAETLSTMALVFGIFIWTLAFWWFAISLVSLLMAIPQVAFHLVWYAIIFPNVGFTIATISIGRALQSNAILWVGSAMTIALTATYLFILLMHARALYRGDILWPGKDEDKET